MEEIKNLLEKRRDLIDEISQLKEKVKEKKRIDNQLFRILQSGMLSLSDLLDAEKKEKGHHFSILGWEITDESSSKMIFVDFELYLLAFPGCDAQKEIINPFTKIMTGAKLKKKMKLLEKKYKIKFSFGCKAST